MLDQRQRARRLDRPMRTGVQLRVTSVTSVMPRTLAISTLRPLRVATLS